ncbi:MAG: M50 family metallopeptidase, partial [Erysipelotrichaceae bacterium]
VGHLLSAKAFKVYCKEFAIGMGPVIYSKQGKETKYSLRAFPFGGFVSMAGEDGVDSDIPLNRTIKGIHPFKRIIVMLAGVIMNIVLAWVILVSIFIYQGKIVIPPKPIIAGVVVDSPAAIAGFQVGDEITKMTFSDGTSIYPKDFNEVVYYVQLYHNQTTFTILRDSASISIKATPSYNEGEKRYYLGLQLPESTTKNIQVWDAFYYGSDRLIGIVNDMSIMIGRLVKGIGLDSVSGPIGIYQVTAQQASYGLLSLLYLTALLSLNVGIFNLLPLPILDGGRVFIILIETIIRRPLNKRAEQALMIASVMLLVFIMVLATGQDIARLF